MLLPSQETLGRIIETDPWISRDFTTTLLESFIKFIFLGTALQFFWFGCFCFFFCCCCVFLFGFFLDVVVRINKSDLLRNGYFTIPY